MKTYIWGLPTRFFHWFMVLGLITAYILGEEEGSLNYHTAFGYFVASLVFFRLIWGFIGPKYSRFTDFPIGLKSLTSFFKNMKESKAKYLGHNPAASLVMLGILLSILIVAATGMLTLASEGQGPLNFLNIGKSEIYKELHEVFVNILIGLAVLHLIGLLVDKIFHGDSGTIFSMFTGYKTKSGEAAVIANTHKVFSLMAIIIAGIFFVIGTMQNFPKEEKKSEHNDKKEHLKKDHDDD